MAEGGGGPALVARGRACGQVRRRGRGWSPYGPEVEDEVCRRVAAGETVRQACATPGMPNRFAVYDWVKRRPGFREKLDAARRAAGTFTAPPQRLCAATMDAIFDRLCEGEALTTICADPGMPVASTVHRWARADPEVREAMALAREIHGDRVGAIAYDEAMAVTPEGWRASEVRLRHLRWWAGKLAPRRYGTIKAVAWDAAAGAEGAWGDGGARPWKVIVKRFTDPLLPGEEDAIVLPGGGRAGDVWDEGREEEEA